MAGAVAGRGNGFTAAVTAGTAVDCSALTDGAATLAAATEGTAAGASATDNLTSSSLLMLLNRLAIRLFGTLSSVPKYLLT